MSPCEPSPCEPSSAHLSKGAIVRLFAALGVIAIAGCGGGGGSNEQAPAPPPPPSEVSLALAQEISEINEWDQDAVVELTVTLSEAQASDVLVNLNSSGSAVLGGDFELFQASVQVPQGSTSASVQLSPIRDFEAEGDETIRLEIGTIEGNAEAGDATSVSLTLVDQGALFEDAKRNIYGKLYVFFGDPIIGEDKVRFVAPIYNVGAAETSSTKLGFWGSRSKSVVRPRLFFEVVDVPAIMPGYGYRTHFEVPLDDFPGVGTYYAILLMDSPAGEAPDARRPQDFGGIVIDPGDTVRIRCPDLARNESPGMEDPLRAQQWNIDNSGQNAYASEGGVEGEDLGMTETLVDGVDGPTGAGVRVAVVDTGMEICHPDLAANVEEGASYNFNASVWFNSLETDPFLPTTYGDHGTSVAGIIGAVADNGIGLRGVAPSSRLRAYNFLATDHPSALLDSHGASHEQPDSSDVDIFNMSYGGFGGEYVTGADERQLFQSGVRNLRSGKGAIFVKAGGNGFGRCQSMLRVAQVQVGEMDTDGTPVPTFEDYDINDEIGCVSVNSDPWHNLPYILSIGGFGADGIKSSYSSAGAALWVSAPAGEWGIDHPAQISTDQMGTEQGYDAFYSGLVGAFGIPSSGTENPHGDYINSFNGTSAAAPNASGAIALLLEAEPDLTWRDVKYLLAHSARQIHEDIPEVKIGFGGEAAVLRHGWTRNTAGYHFHNWYGFGAIDVDQALALASSHTPGSLGAFSDGEHVFGSSTPVGIPDHQGGGVRQAVNVSGIGDTLKVEGVVLSIEVTHPFTNDLGIYLISPAGTESLLNPPFNEVLAANEDLDWELLSNAFYGESPLGEWTLKVVDAAPGDVGTLDAWSLTFYLGEIPEKT